MRQVWLDGRLVDAAGPHLAVFDRGFQLGDGVFESLRARRGIAVELEEHLQRLRENAAALAVRLPFGDEELAAGIAALLAAEGLDGTGAEGGEPGDAAVRITASRGPLAERGLVPPGFTEARSTVAIQAWPHHPPSAAILARGLWVIQSRVRHDPASPLAGVKSISRADHVFAKLEAVRAGADDALFRTVEGALSEATTSNIFIVRGAELVTPAAAEGVLPGTTRSWLLAWGPGQGLIPVERRLWPADLAAADEAFLSSSVAGIVPLTRFEDRPIGDGRPGPRTLRLREARERWIDAISHGEAPLPGGEAKPMPR